MVAPGPIYDDLKRRDFTINSLALSLNRASRGLLLDPNNGLADLELKQLRTVSNYAFYDDPSRILALVPLSGPLRHDAGRTDGQSPGEHPHGRHGGADHARGEASGTTGHRPRIQHRGDLPPLEERGLTSLFAPSLVGPEVQRAGLGKLEKAKALVPYGVDLHTDHLAIFLSTLTEKFSAKDKAALIQTSQLTKSEADNWQKLEAKAKKLEKELTGSKLQRASKLYYRADCGAGRTDSVSAAPLHAAHRPGPHQELPPEARARRLRRSPTPTWKHAGFTPGTPKFAKATPT